MFTVEQIEAAHSKVKSGADFAAYIQDIKKLGVTSYDVFVADGHSDHYGNNRYKTSSPGNHEFLTIGSSFYSEQFKQGLKDHQQGKTDYASFMKMCAKCGIEKWTVLLDKLTCAYYDSAGNEVLVEEIPL
ncbi:DUF1398 domain-containing protein [Sphingobacterium sp. 2149]|uniref:DUF1398 domain-containing protein n=1 Tax=Sphingobacterium sp. 2149 TaxID=2817763 RepID=UPI001AEACA4B|nr:DUF1398 family protein [Sphingobacterium sp. 2149]MDR6736657.1 uncharacterized protein YbcV (DUF1398 family) [Sphingobacterium sp. 2149]